MNPKLQQDQQQARAILKLGWLDSTLLKQGLDYLGQSNDQRDLIDLLVAKSMLNPAQLQHLRQYFPAPQPTHVATVVQSLPQPLQNSQSSQSPGILLDPMPAPIEAVNPSSEATPDDEPELELLSSGIRLDPLPAPIEAVDDSAPIEPVNPNSTLSASLQNSLSASRDSLTASQENMDRSQEIQFVEIESKLGIKIPAQILDNYAHLKELAHGAMGAVFRAVHKSSGQTVALKFILNEHKDPTLMGRFEREARALIKLNHPNIIKIIDYGIIEGFYFYAMEFVEGHDFLEDIQQHSPIPWREALEIMLPVAHALAHVHEHALCHRDIKPANILIEGKTRRPVLADFGLVNKTQEEDSENKEDLDVSAALTRTGEMVGTPAYMAPEQIVPNSSFGKIGAGTDVWAFGVVLSHALAGELPFNFATLVDGLSAVMHDKPRDPALSQSSVPNWLSEVIFRCLAKNVADRPSMADVISMIENGEKNQKAETVKNILIPILLSVVTMLVTVPVVVLVLKPAPIKMQVNSIPEITDKATVKISGTINRTEPVIINGKEVVPVDGKFEYDCPLREGENICRVYSKEDRLKTEKTLKITSDREKPVIVLDNPKVEWNGKSYLILEDKEYVKGSVKDSSRITLIVNLRRTGLTNGRFKWQKNGRIDQLTIKAKDKFQREALLSIPVVTEKQLAKMKADHLKKLSEDKAKVLALERAKQLEPKYRDFHSQSLQAAYNDFSQKLQLNEFQQVKPLFSVNTWMQANATERSAATKFVLSRLNAKESVFEFVEEVVQRREGKVIHIPQFKHKASGLKLNLIPGGVVRVFVYQVHIRPDILAFLHVLGSPYASEDVLKTALDEISFDQRQPEDDDGRRRRSRSSKRYFRLDLAKVFNIPVKDELALRKQEHDIEHDIRHLKRDFHRLEERDEKPSDELTQRLTKLEEEHRVIEKQRDELKKQNIQMILDYFYVRKPEFLPKLQAWIRKFYQRYLNLAKVKPTFVYNEPFLIGDIEVPQRIWSQFGGSLTALNEQKNKAIGPLKPAYRLSPKQTIEWINQFKQLRLPSDVEWQYAARATNKLEWHWQADLKQAEKTVFSADNCWEKDIADVRSNQNHQNFFGLWDTYGHVAEFTGTATQHYLSAATDLNPEELEFRTQFLEATVSVCGGSIWSQLQLCTNENVWLESDYEENWGIWGFRVAASIPWR